MNRKFNSTTNVMPPLLVESSNDKSFQNILKSENIKINLLGTINIEPSGNSIQIDQIRNLKKYLNESGSSYRQIIFYAFHIATLEAQNALLKLVEDTSHKFQFIFQTNNLERVIPTIRSRCKEIRVLGKMNSITNKINLDDLRENLFTKSTSIVKKEDAQYLLGEILALLRLRLLNNDILASHVINKLLKIINLLNYNNLNPQIAVDMGLISIFRNK